MILDSSAAELRVFALYRLAEIYYFDLSKDIVDEETILGYFKQLAGQNVSLKVKAWAQYKIGCFYHRMASCYYEEAAIQNDSIWAGKKALFVRNGKFLDGEIHLSEHPTNMK